MEIKVCNAALGEQLFKSKMISKLKYNSYFILLLISTLLLLTACVPTKDLHNRVNKNPDLQEQISIDKLTLPKKDVGEMEAIYGWLTSDTILYSIKPNDEAFSQLMTWDLKTNKHTVFYQPSAPISTVSISPSKSYVLVSTTLEEKIQSNILNASGEPVYSVSLPAYEITFEWNIYRTGVLFLSTFFEDWSYNSYIVNVKKQTTKMIDHPQPFAQWDSENGMLFLDWQKGKTNLTAPLVRKELDEEEMKSIMLDVVSFKKMKNTLMTIQVETENLDQATYAFFNDKNELITSFSVPQINSYSGWLIPAYDYNEQKGDFFTFIPKKTKKNNQYEGTFTLITFNWKTGKKEKILNNIQNEPISCSPDGSFCLYGYQFDKIIDVKNQKIVKIFKPKQ